jgi:hypothetical protein
MPFNETTFHIYAETKLLAMNKKLSVATIATVIMVVIMRWQGAGLKTAISPGAIVNLEFAKTPERLNELMMNWDIAVVKMNIWLDFLFIVCYTLFLSIASTITAHKWPEGFMRVFGLTFARVAFAAGILDIAENLFMLQSIAGNFTSVSLQLTYCCAAIKFTLAAIILLYLLLSLPVIIRKNKS